MDKPEIENESLTGGGTPEAGAYATTHEEVRQGYPVFGRIAGHSEDLEEVEIHIPYTHRLKWKSICYEKNIRAGIYTLFTGPEGKIKLTFRIKSPEAGFTPTDNQEDPASAGPAIPENHYEQRCNRLEGELHDSDRKIRKQVDEIMHLKRELSADRTATLLTHQKELSEAKESHRNEIERIKEDHRREIKDYETQINRLEKDAFKLELEMKTGNRDVASKIFDLVDENMPGLVTMVTQAVASHGQPHRPSPPTGPQRPNRAGSDEELAKVLGQLYESQQGSQPHSEPNIPSDNADPESGKGSPLAALASDRPDENPNGTLEAGKNGQQKVAL